MYRHALVFNSIDTILKMPFWLNPTIKVIRSNPSVVLQNQHVVVSIILANKQSS